MAPESARLKRGGPVARDERNGERRPRVMRGPRASALQVGACALAAAGLAALCAAVSAGAVPSGGAATLHVFAAASLSDAFEEIASEVERAHIGVRVRLNLAGSQQLATQIEQGAAADVFASADPIWIEYLEKRARIEGEAVVFARNRLVVILPRANPARIGRNDAEGLYQNGLIRTSNANGVPDSIKIFLGKQQQCFRFGVSVGCSPTDGAYFDNVALAIVDTEPAQLRVDLWQWINDTFPANESAGLPGKIGRAHV